MILLSGRHCCLILGPPLQGKGARLCELVAYAGGQHVREGHELLRLVRGVAEHVALVAGPNLLQRLCAQAMHALANVW